MSGYVPRGEDQDVRRILVLASFPDSLVNFRKPMLEAFRKCGCEVHASAPHACGEVLKELAAIGVAFHPTVLCRTGTNPLQDARYYAQLVRLIRGIRPGVVFSYTIKPVIYGSLAARRCGVGMVVSMITGTGYLFMNDSWRRKLIYKLVLPLYKKALSSNDIVFFQNRDNLSRLVGEGILRDPRNAALIDGSGVDVMHFSRVPPVSHPVTFLLIARMLYDKGIFEYAEAARLLKSAYPETRFLLLGPVDTNPTAIPIETIERWNREGWLEYISPTRDVRPYIAQSSVYVLPSYHEGMPRTVLEAMAMGRPIVTTDAPGCRETVIQGRNGFLVPTRDATALMEAMERFIREPSLIAPMGACSRKMAEDRFDVQKVNAVILSRMGLA